MRGTHTRSTHTWLYARMRAHTHASTDDLTQMCARSNAHAHAYARARREALIAAARASEAGRLVKLSETNEQDKAKADERMSKREAHILESTL